jgi:hypothetical protein
MRHPQLSGGFFISHQEMFGPKFSGTKGDGYEQEDEWS